MFLKSERALVDFIFVRYLAGERARFPAECDRLWLLGRDNMLDVDKKLLCPYLWREIRLLEYEVSIIIITVVVVVIKHLSRVRWKTYSAMVKILSGDDVLFGATR